MHATLELEKQNIPVKAEIFDSLMGKIESEYSRPVFQNWFSNLCFHSFQNGVLKLEAPNKFIREWIIANYFTNIRKIAESLQYNIERIDIAVSTKQTGSTPPMCTSDSGNIQINTNDIDAKFSFQNFVSDNSNKIAFNAAKRFAGNIQENANYTQSIIPNHLYIQSSVGMGKTHLLQSITKSLKLTSHSIRLMYISAEKFMHQYVTSVQNNELFQFRDALRSLDVLLFDDLQFICGRSSTQKEFAHTLNALLESGKKIAIACDRSPYALEIDERTKSRLASFLTVKIDRPSSNLRLKILKQRALTLGIDIPEDVLTFISENISNSIRELEGALHKLIIHSHMNGDAIDIKNCSMFLQDSIVANVNEISIEQILNFISKHYGISKSEILSTSKKSHLVNARQIIIYMTHLFTKLSYSEIGRRIGKRNHTTVLHSLKKIKSKMQLDSNFKLEIENIQNKIYKQEEQINII